MDLTKNALRGFFSKKTQAILAIVLVIFGVWIYTLMSEQGDVMLQSIVEYDASQNVEDYSFIPRLNFTEAEWETIFADYNIPESVQADFKNGKTYTSEIIQGYNVNLYDYQQDYITELESAYDLTIETSFNKMITNTADSVRGHEYRVFSDTGSINKPYIVEGALPSAGNELTVSPEYAKYNNLGVGGTLEINGVSYTISGFVYHPAQIYPVVSSNVVKESSVYYPETQSIIFMTEDGLGNLDGQVNYLYKSTTNQALTKDEKNILYYELYDTNEFEIIDSGLKTMTHGEVYMQQDGMSTVTLIVSIMFAVACMIVIAQIMKRRVEADKKQIGTLKSLGYNSWETAGSYCASAVIISLVGSTVGYVLGHLSYGLVIDAIYTDYNLPILSGGMSYATLLCVLIVPLIILVSTALITAFLNLSKSPRELMDENEGSNVNALGKLVERTFRKASFVIRTKYQIACRSVSKLATMFSIGFLASVVLLIGLIMSVAYNGIMDKTFAGMEVENIIVFNTARNISDTPTTYEDEETVFAKDFFINEVIYQNGDRSAFDATNKIETETVGINFDSTYANLFNEKGEYINNTLETGFVINKVLQGKYGLNIGDKLVLQNTHDKVEVEVAITGIADQYSGYLMFADIGYMNNVFDYEKGTYNGVLSNHQYSLSDPEINKILSIAAFKDGLSGNIGSFQIIFIVLAVLAVVLAFVLMLVSANLVIEENSKNISTFKVLGYSSREISDLVVNTYTPLMLLGYALAIPTGIAIMNFLKTFMEEKFDMPIMVSMNVVYALIGFVVIILTYYAGLYFSRRNIDKIVLAEALKYNE